jgi:hypothetical protein
VEPPPVREVLCSIGPTTLLPIITTCRGDKGAPSHTDVQRAFTKNLRAESVIPCASGEIWARAPRLGRPGSSFSLTEWGLVGLVTSQVTSWSPLRREGVQEPECGPEANDDESDGGQVPHG